MRKFLVMSATLGLLGAGFGCSRSFDRARANYHDNRAEHAAARGEYYKASKEERKADTARRDERHDVLP